MSYVTILSRWPGHLSLAAETRRAVAVGNAERFEAVAAHLERVERADARLRAAQEAGRDDSWWEDE